MKIDGWKSCVLYIMWVSFEHFEEFVSMEELRRYFEFVDKRFPLRFHTYCAIGEGTQVALVRAR